MIHMRFAIKGASEFIAKVEKTKNFYVQLSDEGGVRFSKQAAYSFASQVKTNILTGRFKHRFEANEVRFTPTSTKTRPHTAYAEKYNKGNSSPWGVLTGTMERDIQAFRTEFSGPGRGTDTKRRGYVVGIKRGQAFYAGSSNKLKWFEHGTSNNQPARPIMKYSLDQFMITEFPAMMTKIANEFKAIWKGK